MIHADYCSKCKVKDTPLIKYAKRGYKQFYRCRSCVSLKERKYRTTEAGKQAYYRANKKQYQKNRDHVLARAAVHSAIKKGLITKPTDCSKCHKKGRIQGHHPDYAQRLKVIWLCVSCHATTHAI